MSAELFVGTSGWSYADWQGVVYPAKRFSGFHELSYLANVFDTVEVNSSFYRPPTARMSESWLRRIGANPKFLFTAKIWQRFTHERSTRWTPQDVETFREGIRPLHEAAKLGALLVQFPWSFPATPPNIDWLARIDDAFPEHPLVVEVRHVSWMEDGPLDFLRERRLSFCNIDQPHSTMSIGPTSLRTGALAYYRFHGRNRQAWFDKKAGRDERYNYLYSQEELEPWAKDIEAMMDDANRIFVMNNNHYRGQAAVNALQLKARLSGTKVAVPEPLLSAYPVLESIAAPRRGQRFLDF